MFNEANGEHLFVYAKLEPFIEDLRREFNAPQAMAHLEKVVKQVPDYEDRLTAIRERMKKMAARIAQRQTAAAAN
jgi:cysteinyl-tRNA synthetase